MGGDGEQGGGDWKPQDKNDKPTTNPNPNSNPPIIPHPTAPPSNRQDIEAENQRRAIAEEMARLERERKERERKAREDRLRFERMMERLYGPDYACAPENGTPSANGHPQWADPNMEFFLSLEDGVKSNSLPLYGPPNTWVQRPDGKQWRHYGPDGKADVDLDYDEYNNRHPDLPKPHQHDWDEEKNRGEPHPPTVEIPDGAPALIPPQKPAPSPESQPDASNDFSVDELIPTILIIGGAIVLIYLGIPPDTVLGPGFA